MSRWSRPRRASRSSSRRPSRCRPDVQLGDYKHFNFQPEIETIDDARVDKVVEELRDQNATLAAVEDRGARDGDYAVISFTGSRNGEPFDGGSSERMPLILGQERLIPGFEANLLGLEVGDSTEFDITFPDDYPETELAGQQAHFAVELRELREKVQPELDDDFIGTLGDFADLDALRADIKVRLERNALDRARHEFADRIIDYAVANATLELPHILVDQEVEVMHDEFRGTLARQGISEEAYLKAIEKTDADLHAEFRPGAEKRVRILLVLSKVADAEGRRRSPTRRSTPRSRAAASATPTTHGCRSTSTPTAAAPTSGARSAAAGSSRTSSTSGSPPIPIIQRCRISRTPRRPPSRASRRPPMPPSMRRTQAPSLTTFRLPPAEPRARDR